MQRVRPREMDLLRQRADHLGALPSVLEGHFERGPGPSGDVQEDKGAGGREGNVKEPLGRQPDRELVGQRKRRATPMLKKSKRTNKRKYPDKTAKLAKFQGKRP